MVNLDWNDCINQADAIKITKNQERVNSLINSSKRRKDFVMSHKVEETNAEILFSDMYDSCLELIHAFVMNEGYKVNNHHCLCFYFRDILKNKELFLIFDRYRKIRNDVLYYGKLLDKPFSETAIKELNNLYNKISKLIK